MKGAERPPTALSDDHYHWLTSLVSNSHLERATCRLIAASAFLLGLIPLVLVEDQSGPHTPVRTAVAVVVVLSAAIVAIVWTTRCWPTRGQSRASALVATVCVAAAVLVIPDPLVAALGGIAFAGPAGFTALFHTRRLLICTWALAAVTLISSAWRLLQTDMLLAAAVVPLVVLINVFAGFAWLLVMHLTDAKVSSARIDPLTGLYHRAGFDEKLSTVLGARDRTDDRHLVIVVVHIDTHGLLVSMDQRARAERTCVAAARQLRGAVRRDSVLAYLGDGGFVIAELFTSTDPHFMLERLRGTLTDRPAQLSASIGAVSTLLAPLAPHPVKDVLDELIRIADHARHDAHRAGGNTTRCVINPSLTVLAEPYDDAI